MNALTVVSSAACALVALGPVPALAEEVMSCAPEGEAFCGSAEDMAVINTSQFEKDIEKAGPKAYAKDTSGAQALEAVIGAGKLSATCLACQGASLDCAVKQSECFSICSDAGNCAASCKKCIRQYCDVEKACGGVPGVTVQMPFACADPGNKDDLTVAADVLETDFIGTCEIAGCTNETGCNHTHNHTHHLSGAEKPATLRAAAVAVAALLAASSASF